ncbi:GNAT family N-acetyltransferase [Sphingomonas adhaesiva]|uniref:GNAT family N-acetyltransferase n=1 Tax=Sphingomonas adhaesiva TaxID=28212 RepID=UPI002FFCEB45
MADARATRWRRRVAAIGWRGVLRKAFGDHVYRRSDSVVLECRREWSRHAPPRASGDLTFLTLAAGDAIPPLCAWLAHRRADFSAMHATGKLGLFVLRAGVAVGCAWIAFEDHHDPAAREHYRVAPGEAYHYCWLVDPVERTRGTTLAFARHVLAVLAARGVTRQFGVVDRTNRASYRVLQHFGYRECGIRVRHIYLLHRRWTRVAQYDGTLGLIAA